MASREVFPIEVKSPEITFLVIRGNYFVDTKRNSTILHISSGYPQILLLRQTLDLGTICAQFSYEATI